MEADQVKQLIADAFSQKVQIDVQTADGVHFEAVVISEAFADLNRVKRQQKVYQNLRAYIESGALHAIALKTYTFQEWADQKSEG